MLLQLAPFFGNSTHIYIVVLSSTFCVMFANLFCFCLSNFIVIAYFEIVVLTMHFELLQMSSFFHIEESPPYATITWSFSFLQL